MSQNRLTDFLPVKEKDKITFLDLEVIDGKNLRDAKAFILPSFLEKINIEGFDSVAALESIRSFLEKF
ncbi:hypothetical protein [Convivina intestini]|uniref:hypothetical protein n=1 Tax=Convivina intestini TaxID=1505726 RepID=UPI00201089E3|nr:hypothetical protein [Convivina intestini]CAH1857007.1 hypothetical protein R078131_01517 [Convivina intestini]